MSPKSLVLNVSMVRNGLLDKIILACGAWVDTLIDMQGQLVAKTWTLAHIQITDEDERRKLKETPVIFDVEKGFFFEPDHDTGMVKICNEVRAGKCCSLSFL